MKTIDLSLTVDELGKISDAEHAIPVKPIDRFLARSSAQVARNEAERGDAEGLRQQFHLRVAAHGTGHRLRKPDENRCCRHARKSWQRPRLRHDH